MRRLTPVILILSVALFSCKAKEAMDKAQIATDLAKTGSTSKLMKDVENDTYDAPADGKLTDAQVQMYLKVRDRERAIAQVAKQQLQQHADAAKKAGDKSLAGMMEGFKGLGSVADVLTADIRAAKDLGFNTQEYVWVKGQILSASGSAMGQELADVMSAQMDATYDQTKKAYDEAKDDETKAMFKQTLDAIEEQKKEAAANKQQEDPSITYNRQLLSKYENTLNALASEMGKWEEKPGDAQKSVDQWQKDVDKAKADATAAKAQQ